MKREGVTRHVVEVVDAWGKYKKDRLKDQAVFSGELGGSRTPNLLGRNQVLYPLSYESFSFDSAKVDNM